MPNGTALIRTPGPAPVARFTRFDNALAAIGLRKLALKRVASRYEYEAMRHYLEAAAVDRTTASWRKITANPDDVIASDNATIRGRIRSIVQNSGYANHAKDVLVDWTVGTGIVTQSQIFYSNDTTENSKLNSIAEDRKRRWMDQADATNQLHWYEIQRQFLGEVIETGDCLLYRRFVTHPGRFNRPRILPLAYEVIEAERLTSYGIQYAPKGNPIINGIEIDASTGQPVAYHVLFGMYNTKTERIPAESIIHGFRQDRPGQHSGISWFAPVLSQLNYLHDILAYRLVAQKVQSAIAVIVSHDPNGGTGPGLPGLGASSGARTVTDTGDKERAIEPGMMMNAGTGRVTPFIPNPSNDLDPVTKLVLRGVAVGIGSSYELLTGDYSMVNFAGGRLVRQDTRRRLLPIHDFVCRHLEDPAHVEWVNAELAFGTMRKPPAKTADTIYDVRYSKPRGDAGVNPLQDANAAVARMAAQISTLRDEVENGGGDWQEYLEQQSIEKDFGKKLGMIIHQALFEDTASIPDKSKVNP